MSKYNLIDESWIPVRDLKGNRKEIGIFEALTQAENISLVEDPSPLVTAALHRFLVAILYRALEGPYDIDEAKAYFREGMSKVKIRNYLEKWRHRFWLFDERYPFGQIADFTPQAWRSWTVLAAEHNADNAKVLFDHVGVSSSGSISYASAARWLLATQTFAVSSGKSELSHTGTSPSAGALMAIAVGKTLADTLLFCLVPQNRDVSNNDLPAWECMPVSLDSLKSGVKRKVLGIANLYSWQGRSIRFKNTNSEGISEIAFASGVGYEDSGVVDPMLAYAIVDVIDKDTKVTSKKRVAVHLGDRGVWRDFDSLLPDDTQLAPKVLDNMLTLARNSPARMADSVMVFGQKYNPPRPNIVFWRMERFILPKAITGDRYIRGDIHVFLSDAKDANMALYKACARYAHSQLSRGERKPEKRDVSNFIDQMLSLPHYWSTLETRFHEVLRDYKLVENYDEIYCDWLIAVRNALNNAWELHQRSIANSDAWAIRAIVKADGIIGKKIEELNRSIQSLKGVVA